MRPETEPLRRRARPLPDLEAEQEVDLSGYGRSLAARWWIVAAAVAVGIVLGYLLSLSSGSLYRATATLYLGQPVSPTGTGQLQTLGSNPSTVNQIVRSESTVAEVAAEVGVPAGELRRGVSTGTVAGAVTRQGQNPLVTVSVRGPWREPAAGAANRLAETAAQSISGYVDGKIEALEAQLAGGEEELAAIDGRIAELEQAVAAGDLSGAERLSVLGLIGFAEQRRGEILSDQTHARQLLSLAENVERSRVVAEARPVRVDARSARSSVVVGALIGLIAGSALALLAGPLAARRRRPA